jgi:hypothetical protein
MDFMIPSSITNKKRMLPEGFDFDDDDGVEYEYEDESAEKKASGGNNITLENYSGVIAPFNAVPFFDDDDSVYLTTIVPFGVVAEDINCSIISLEDNSCAVKVNYKWPTPFMNADVLMSRYHLHPFDPKLVSLKRSINLNKNNYGSIILKLPFDVERNNEKLDFSLLEIDNFKQATIVQITCRKLVRNVKEEAKPLEIIVKRNPPVQES